MQCRWHASRCDHGFLCTLGNPIGSGTDETTVWKLSADRADNQSESSGKINLVAHDQSGALGRSTGGRKGILAGSGFTATMVPGTATSLTRRGWPLDRKW
jgi:hypothetical protein